MDSLNPQHQNAYPPSQHLQDRYQNDQQQQQQQQQQQMNFAFQDNPAFGLSETEMQTCERVRQNDSRSSSGNSQTVELARANEVEQLSSSPSAATHLTGHMIEIESLPQGLDKSQTIDETNTHTEASPLNDDCDDEAAFVALCAEASFVMNKQDPSKRYYINKLYQPLHSNQDETTLDEQDDDYLLYQELKFLESVAQESTDERQRVQLTKILEDDEGEEGDEDVDGLVDSNPLEDPLDRLQLTTIIEAFDSFPTSPLIDSCHGADPLIGGHCDVNDQCQAKPDSTRHEDSPNSSRLTNNYIDLSHDHQHYDCEQSSMQSIGHRTGENSNLSTVTSNSSINHDPHHNHLQHHHHHHQQQHHTHQHLQHHSQLARQQQYNNHMNSNISSETSCFQQVSSSFVQQTDTNQSVISNFMPHFNNSDQVSLNQQQQQQQYQANDKSCNKNVRKQAKKRGLQAIQQDDTKPSYKNTKGRVKKKRNTIIGDPKDVHSDSDQSVSPVDNVTSSMMNQIETARCSVSDVEQSLNHATGSQHQPSIIHDDICSADRSMSMIEEDENDSITDDGKGHHMSKYRRRTANARERIRMREINQAFEKLKKVVPVELIQQSASGDESDQTSVSSRRGGKSNSNNSGNQSDSQSVKLTKITTLRLAVSYIAKLSELLNQHSEGDSLAINPQSRTLGDDTMDSLKVKNSNSPRGRKRRRRSSTKKSVDEQGLYPTNKTKNKIVEAGKCIVKGATNLKEGATELRIEPAIVMNQTNQQRPILITNNVLNGGMQPTTFIPIQQQEKMNQGHQIQAQQQQFAYTHCSQQPMTISQTSNSNNQFVTPVAVAILGIPTSAGNRCEPQSLQLLGIQNASQLQQRGQHIQTNSPYSVITQQPQQVAFTLDDINGVSVLRLANSQNHVVNPQQQTIQFQQGASIIQPQVLTTSQATGYNYTTTYQPVHISQVQGTNMATVRPLTVQQHQQATAVQFRSNNTNGRTQETHLLQISNDLRATISHQNTLIRDNNIVTTTAKSNINTGTTNDCRNFGISPNMITQHLNNNNSNNKSLDNINNNKNNNISSGGGITNNSNTTSSSSNSNTVASTQFKTQQSNCSENQFVSSNNMVQQSARIFQTQPVSRANTISTHHTKANLIYINPANISTGNNLPKIAYSQQATVQNQTQSPNKSNLLQNDYSASSQTDSQLGGAAASYEQMKFVTQFSSQVSNGQDKNFHANEANIRQLVATLATSIQPDGDKSSQGKQDELASERQQQLQRQPPKRTYRFHNYDGNMITNHLYNNHDKSSHHLDHPQQQPQQPSTKKDEQLQHSAHQLTQLDKSAATTTSTTNTASRSGLNSSSQRSRQNSLSSTCSTNSCSSSSLTSLSTSSPSIPMISLMVRSPASVENGSAASLAQSVIEETGTEVVGCN